MQWIPTDVMGWLVPVVVLVLVGVGLDRLTSGNRAARRRAEAATGESAGSGALGEFVEIFQPSAVYLAQEKERQRLDIAQTPTGDQPFDVDLEAGVAYLPVEASAPEQGPAVR